MKKLIFTLVALSMSIGLSAQSFKWGARINVGSPNLKIEDIQSSNTPTELLSNTDAVLTYQFGLFARLMVAGIYIQPEAMFSSSANEITFRDVLDNNQVANEVSGEVKINKIDLPILVGKRFFKIFRVNVGPVFSLLLNDEIKQIGAKESWNEITGNYNNATLGLQYGVGIDISRITVDLRVENGFQSISEELTIGETTFQADQRLEQIMLSVGFKF